jgi:hypothetical protein
VQPLEEGNKAMEGPVSWNEAGHAPEAVNAESQQKPQAEAQAAQPETPNVEPPRPAIELPDTSERLREMHPGAQLGWTDHGGMVEQQSSANEWVRATSEARAGDGERASMQEQSAVEMTDSRQAAQTTQYSRWTGEPLGETAEITQSAGIGQSH